MINLNEFTLNNWDTGTEEKIVAVTVGKYVEFHKLPASEVERTKALGTVITKLMERIHEARNKVPVEGDSKA